MKLFFQLDKTVRNYTAFLVACEVALSTTKGFLSGYFTLFVSRRGIPIFYK